MTTTIYICFCFLFPLHLHRQKTKSRPVKKSLIFYHVFDFTSTYFWERENLVGQSLRFKGSCWRHYSISTILKLWELNTLFHKQIHQSNRELTYFILEWFLTPKKKFTWRIDHPYFIIDKMVSVQKCFGHFVPPLSLIRVKE